MSFFTQPFVFQDGLPLTGEQLNQDFVAVFAALNSLQSQLSTLIIGGGLPNVYDATAAPYNLSPSNAGSVNDTALQNAVNAAIAGGPGGIVYIPAGAYQFQNGVTITGQQKGLIIQGAGGFTQLLQTNGNNNIFTVVLFSGGNHGGQGLRIRNLWFEYDGVTSGTGTAISISNCNNITAEECVFWNCPSALADDVHSLQSGLVRCTINNGKVANCTQVSLGGNQDFIFATTMLGAAGGSVAGQVGVQLFGVKEFYCYGCQISEFITGVEITTGGSGPQTLGVYFTNCFIPAYTNGVTIIPDTSGHTIYDIHFSNCRFQSSNNVTGSSGVYVDSNGGANTNVQGIYFDNCTATGWGDAGVLIGVASMVVFTGGMYSSNGLNPSVPQNGAGVAIVGAADNVRFNNVILDGIFAWQGGVQPYGLAMSGGCTDVWATDCSIFANGTAPIYASGQGQHCFVKDCRGYNNIGTIVSTVQPPSGSTGWFDALGYGSPNTPWTTPYFGDYCVSAVGGTITAVYTSHDRTDLTKTALGALTPLSRTMNAQDALRIDYSGTPTFVIVGV